MKKKLLLLLPSFMCIGALTGCGGGDGKVHVKFWHTMGQANQGMLDRMIAEFEEANPDVKIDAYSQGGYDDIAGKIGDAIPAGTTPTMSFCYPDNVASYLVSGAIEDMTPYINNAEYGLDDVNDFVKEYWDEGANYQQAGIYSLPYAKSTEVLFYNATAFEEYGFTVPTTWDEMWTLCDTIKTRLGEKVSYPLGYDSDSNLFITMCEQNGIAYTSKNGTKPEDHFLFNNADAKAMVTNLKTKYDAKAFLTKGTQPNATYTSTLFTNGKILMSIGSTGGTTYNKSLNFDIGVAPIPAGSKNAHVITQGPSICFFARAKAAEKVAAWKFYKHITNAQNSANFAMSTGYEPVRKSSYETEAYKAYIARGAKSANGYVCKAGGDLLAVAANCTKNECAGKYFSSDVFNGSDVARDEVGGIVSNVLLGTKTIDKAFEDAYTNCLFVG